MTDKEILKAFQKKRKAEQEKAVIRPAFTYHKELFMLCIGSLVLIGVVAAAAMLGNELTGLQMTALMLTAGCLFLFTQIRNILLLLIFLYQKYAPAFVRSACLFTPSCSEYMRLSILKYGVWKGVGKGLNRLRRCHLPNGGIDEP